MAAASRMPDNKIQIWSMTAQSYGFLLRHPGALIRVGWLPLLALFGLNLLFDAYAPWPQTIDPVAMFPRFGSLSANLLGHTLIAAVVLVTWHRFVLFGQTPGRGVLGIRLGRRELLYTGMWLLLCLLFLFVFSLGALLFLAVGFGGMLGTHQALIVAGSAGAVPLGQKTQFIVLTAISAFGAFLCGCYATCRLSLALPALATDKTSSFGHAWQISGGNGWRLVASFLLVMLPMQVGHLAAAQLAAGLADSALRFPAALIASGFTLLLVLVMGTLFSLFSQSLEQASEAEAEPQPAALAPRGAS